MMSDPENNLYRDMLADYVSDTPDDGFSDHLMFKLNAQKRRETQIRRYGLLSAFFVGGIIAGTQFPSLLNLIKGAGASIDTSSAASLPVPVWAIAAGCVIACAGLMVLDDRSNSLL